MTEPLVSQERLDAARRTVTIWRSWFPHDDRSDRDIFAATALSGQYLKAGRVTHEDMARVHRVALTLFPEGDV